jgi:hypothetical protein
MLETHQQDMGGGSNPLIRRFLNIDRSQNNNDWIDIHADNIIMNFFVL